jgi:hypothetical protein
MNGEHVEGKCDRTEDRRGVVRRQARDMGRKMVPAMQLPERQEDEALKRDAYQLALANRHKPWARRYLRQYMGRFY